MRVLFPFIKQYRKECIIAPSFKLLEAMFDLLVPLVVANMIDSGGERRTIWFSFGLLVAMAVIGLGCTLVAQYYAAKAATGISGALRQALFDRIQSFSFAQLDRFGGDTLITRLTGDVNQVQTGLNMGLRLLLRSPFIVLGATVMAFTVDVRCALVFCVTVPILFVIVYFIMQRSIPLYGRVQARLDRVTALTRENLTGVRVIRAFRREGRAAEEFERSSRQLTELNLFVGKISALMNPLTYVLINLAAVAVIMRAGGQVYRGDLPQGQVVALYNYMLQIIVELVKLASLIITLNKALACARRTAVILDEKPSMTYPDAGEAEPVAADAPAVEFSHVTFTYPASAAPSLFDIGFSARHGQTIGIIGGTGSGKTTLVDLIARSYDADCGEIRLFGQPIASCSKDMLRRSIGVVPQRSVLFRGTVRDNLRWGDENATDDALWSALQTAQADQIIRDKPGALDFTIEQGGRNLSGGQRQRLTIARALVRRPKILILDDSASALDYATDAALRRALAKIPDMTVFLVSQRIACVRQADRILVLDNGVLAGSGTHEALMAECEVYREIYYSQFPEERTREGGDEHEA